MNAAVLVLTVTFFLYHSISFCIKLVIVRNGAHTWTHPFIGLRKSCESKFGFRLMLEVLIRLPSFEAQLPLVSL